MIDPVKLSQELIRFKTITPLDENIVDYLTSVLTKIGFTCYKLVFDDVTNLYARYGHKGRNFAFAGHTDVVPAGDDSAWKFDPFSATIENNILYGRGASDMKVAIACFIAAFSEFIDKNLDFSESVSLIITGDEEGDAINGTVKILDWMAKNNEILSACIVGEPTSVNTACDMIKIGRRGSICFDLTVNGTQGHVAYPHLADNPITKLIEILNTLKHYQLDCGSEFFQPSNLEITNIEINNKATNIIPARAKASFNIRINDLHKIENIEKIMHELCKRVTSDYSLIIKTKSEAFIVHDALYTDIVIDAVQEATGIKPEISTSGGVTDARFIKNYCPVIELGMLDKTAHKIDENVTLDDIYNLSKCYYMLLEKYFLKGIK